MTKLLVAWVLLIIGVLLVPRSALAQTYLTRVAASGMPAPGGGFFGEFQMQPANDHGHVVFVSGGTARGIYEYDHSGVQPIARQGMPGVPQSGYGQPSIYEGDVVFRATPYLYARRNGQLKLIAGPGTPLTYPYTYSPRIRGERVAFGAGTESESFQAGLFERVGDGPIRTLADQSTTIPGGTSLSGKLYFRPYPVGKDIYLPASFNELWKVSPDSIAVAVRSGDAVMGSSNPMGMMISLASDDSGYAIAGTLADGTNLNARTAIVRGDENGLHLVAQPFTPVAGQGADFEYVAGVSISDGKVLFKGINHSKGTEGLYLHDGTSVLCIIDDTAPIDGKLVEHFTFGDEALSGDSAVFYVRFADESEAIYLATVPEPRALASLILLFGGFSRRRPRGNL